MLKNYFKSAWRNLIGNKFYSTINISGLAVGLATGIMLLLWVQNEKSYDKFHEHYADIYKLSAHFNQDGKETTWTDVPGPLAVYAATFPEVKSVVRIETESSGQVLSDKESRNIFANNNVAFVDNGFFSMFDFHLISGDRTSLFPNNNSMVITQSTAKKLYGNMEVLGKIVQYYGSSFTVTGVLADFPENSSQQYDAIVPMDFCAAQFTARGGNGDWKTIDTDLGNFTFYTYVQLQPGADYSKIGNALTEAYKKARNGESNSRFELQNLASVHLIGADGNTSALRMVQIFLLISILLLLIAGINYVNLSTARSSIRA
ncbi:MAG TPA: ABC transporter permease, partial [Mucilaginibacter sp.]